MIERRHKQQEIVRLRTSVTTRHAVLTLDPDILKNLSLVFGVGAQYSEMKFAEFDEYMKRNSFWTDLE